MVIEARTPSRIDLAGGTLDLFPLYLWEEGGLTVNMGISLGSHVRLATREDAAIRIRSEDTGAEHSATSLEELEIEGPLAFVARIVRFYRPEAGLDITTRNDAPHGSGLGSSSALLIALSGALRELNQADIPDEQLVFYGANLECQDLGVPVGKQDYYGALHGGINAIYFEVEGDRVDQIGTSEAFREELERRLILSFTGEPRFSGATNWSMFKAYVDNEGGTRRSMRSIKDTAFRMLDAIEAEDFEALGGTLAEEWNNRKQLAEGVTTDQIERLMAAASEAGAVASKICGAGGGGCMITLAAAGREQPVAEALAAGGARILEYEIARKGLEVVATN
ncbi:MAG: hypothetical protein ACE5R4_15495 [Armatimonadota bacterium]